jgi:hypothetical protein
MYEAVLSALTVRRCPRLALVALALSLGAVGCGSRAAPGGEPRANDNPVDWDRPIPAALEVPSIDQARPALAFTPYVPTGLGSPDRVLVTDPAIMGDPTSRVLALIYDLPSLGRVVVEEGIPQIPPAQFNSSWRQQIALNGSPDVHGTLSEATIRNGLEAFIGTSEDGSQSTILWLEGDIEILITGPTLDRDQAVSLANSI